MSKSLQVLSAALLTVYWGAVAVLGVSFTYRAEQPGGGGKTITIRERVFQAFMGLVVMTFGLSGVALSWAGRLVDPTARLVPESVVQIGRGLLAAVMAGFLLSKPAGAGGPEAFYWPVVVVGGLGCALAAGHFGMCGYLLCGPKVAGHDDSDVGDTGERSADRGTAGAIGSSSARKPLTDDTHESAGDFPRRGGDIENCNASFSGKKASASSPRSTTGTAGNVDGVFYVPPVSQGGAVISDIPMNDAPTSPFQ